MRARAILGLLAVGGAAWGCEDGESLTAVVPAIAVEPTAIDFGAVPLGARRRWTLEIRNEGTAPLRLLDLSVGEPFDLEDDRGSEGPIPPGGRLEVDVVFSAASTDPATGTLGVRSDDPDRPEVDVALSGVGVEGAITVVPDALDFTLTPVGGRRSGEVVLENLGLDPVSGRLVQDGFARPGFFQSGGAPVERELTLPPRAALPLEVTYRPLEPGDHGGVIRFETCGPRCGVEISVAATAVAPAVRLEPPALNFGDVGLGERRVEQVVVLNEGGQPVTVTEVGVRGGAALDVTPVTSPPVALRPGDRLAIDVGFAPEEALEVSGAVVVGLDDPAFPRAEVGLAGRGVGPRFLVAPSRLEVGVVTEAVSTRRLIIGLNAGSSLVEVQDVGLSGDPALQLGPLPGFPVGLGGGETLPVEVVYTPSQLGIATATVTFTSSDPNQSEVRVPVVAGFAERVCDLEIDPSGVINFGSIVPGFQRERRIRITNRGGEACTLLAGGFRAPADPALVRLGPEPFPRTLGSGESIALDFQFGPTEERETKAVYVLRTDEPLFPVRNLSFVGTGAGYFDLLTQPRVVDFGEVGIDCDPEARELQLVNAGSGPVTVTSAQLDTISSEIDLRPTSLPSIIPTGASLSLTLTYDSIDVGLDEGLLLVEVDGLPFPIVVPVLGRGSVDPRVSDRFVQPTETDVDVLFVIDDSCSMADEQAAIARNFRDFIRQADLRQVDFQIGVTTTSLFPAPGILRGPPLTRATPSLDQAFAAQTSVGTDGSGIEQGLEAALGAVNRSGALGGASLFRSDASQVFVIVSDEDDQSRLPVVAYTSALQQRFAQLTAAVVTGGPTGCFSSDGSATPAPRYREFVDLLQGIETSICADWSQTLTTLGQTAFGLPRRFPLSRPLDPSAPVVVRVDGNPLPAGAFVVDAAAQAVIVEPPPPEGATVVVEYRPAC